jgi:hypothetical protein
MQLLLLMEFDNKTTILQHNTLKVYIIWTFQIRKKNCENILKYNSNFCKFLLNVYIYGFQDLHFIKFKTLTWKKWYFKHDLNIFLENTFRMVKKLDFQLAFLVHPSVFSPFVCATLLQKEYGFLVATNLYAKNVFFG